MTEEEATVTIAIGGADEGRPLMGEPVVYHIRETRAPEAYDGFGTFTVAKLNPFRIVMIRDEHYKWQSSRYASGIFACTVPAHAEREHVIDALWKRLTTTPTNE